MSSDPPYLESVILLPVHRPSRHLGELVTALLADGAAAGRIVVVDDVVTTGSTLAEVVRALRTAGHDVVAAAAAFGVPRTGAPSTALGGSTDARP